MENKSKPIELKTEYGEKYEIPQEGSLGLLALGYVGLMAWREKRNSARSVRSPLDSQQSSVGSPQQKVKEIK